MQEPSKEVYRLQPRVLDAGGRRMKCPYRVDEVQICQDGKTWIYKEFADCYGELCPYFDKHHMSNCRKVTNEIGCYANQEIEGE